VWVRGENHSTLWLLGSYVNRNILDLSKYYGQHKSTF